VVNDGRGIWDSVVLIFILSGDIVQPENAGVDSPGINISPIFADWGIWHHCSPLVALWNKINRKSRKLAKLNKDHDRRERIMESSVTTTDEARKELERQQKQTLGQII
jgi:hypothetical protein